MKFAQKKIVIKLVMEIVVDEGNKTHNQIKRSSNLATGLHLSFTTLSSFSKILHINLI